VWYGNAGSTKGIHRELTVILLFDPEGVASYSPGFVRTLGHSATEIGPEHMTVAVSYGWPPRDPSLLDVPLDSSELYAFSGPMSCVGLVSRVGHLSRSCCRNHSGRICYGACPRVLRASSCEPWAVCRNPLGVERQIGSLFLCIRGRSSILMIHSKPWRSFRY